VLSIEVSFRPTKKYTGVVVRNCLVKLIHFTPAAARKCHRSVRAGMVCSLPSSRCDQNFGDYPRTITSKYGASSCGRCCRETLGEGADLSCALQHIQRADLTAAHKTDKIEEYRARSSTRACAHDPMFCDLFTSWNSHDLARTAGASCSRGW
jgi:hypothetical protein